MTISPYRSADDSRENFRYGIPVVCLCEVCAFEDQSGLLIEVVDDADADPSVVDLARPWDTSQCARCGLTREEDRLRIRLVARAIGIFHRMGEAGEPDPSRSCATEDKVSLQDADNEWLATFDREGLRIRLGRAPDGSALTRAGKRGSDHKNYPTSWETLDTLKIGEDYD